MKNPNDLLTSQDLMVLVDSGRELTTQVDLEVLLDAILHRACALTDSLDSSVILLNAIGDALYFAAATGADAENVLKKFGPNAERQIPIRESKAGQVFSTGVPIVEHNVDGHYKGVDHETKKKTKSMVCVPLTVPGKRLGVMQLLNKRSGNYTERDQVLLQRFAEQAAVAIRNAQLFDRLLAYMGLYSSANQTKDRLALMEELERPAWSERLSIMFADMRGFTQLCHLLNNPSTTQKRLNEFITLLANQVLKHSGMVNKVQGDGLLALFRNEDHAQRAVECGFDIVEEFQGLHARWNEKSNVVLDFLDVGIGIATDDVILGSIGTQLVRDFTVIGTAVNLAAAFEQSARNGKHILVDQLTFQRVKDTIGDYEGPLPFELRKPGQEIAHKFLHYHLKSRAPVRGESPVESKERPCIFVSHSQKDRDFVEQQLIAPLHEFGIDTWYSRDDIPLGDPWQQSISEGLERCQWMVVVVSENSADSLWVRREVRVAMAKKCFEKTIIVIRLDDTDVKRVNEFLITVQTVDVRETEKVAERLKRRILQQ